MSARKFKDLREDLYARSPQSRERVERQVRELTEQLGLTELRNRRERTQAQIAELIGTTQSGVSRLERQDDLRISTLRDYIAATGGILRLVASYSDFEAEIDLPTLRARQGASPTPREFRVVWQNQQTRQLVHVGWLRFSGSMFSFAYTADAHLDEDFLPFPAFPHLQEEYESVDLFPFFADRVAASAVDGRTLAAALGLEDSEATPVELLARSWGITPHDTIQIIPEAVELGGGLSVRLFLASGVRHVDKTDPSLVARRIGQLRRNDPLALRDEPENPVNPKAVILETNGQAVGWVPDYLLEEIHKLRDAGDRLSVRVEHANESDVGWHLRLLCRLEVRGQPDA